jgi:hypothetical protein
LFGRNKVKEEADSLNLLYRGVSIEHFKKTAGQLVPKKIAPFEYTFHYGEGITYGSGVKYGSSPTNAVIRHQLRQEGFPTSGVSTTPILERALYYASRGGREASGYVFKIDRDILGSLGVMEYIVADYVVGPSIPEDREVILVAADFGVLPKEIVVEVCCHKFE